MRNAKLFSRLMIRNNKSNITKFQKWCYDKNAQLSGAQIQNKIKSEIFISTISFLVNKSLTYVETSNYRIVQRIPTLFICYILRKYD